MIRHLAHHELDKSAWDRMLEQAPARLWYARSAVLDAAAPAWEALIDEDTGCFMPLTGRHRWGIHYLFQPYALQQSGVFGPVEAHPGIVAQFVNAIPERYRYMDIAMNAQASLQLMGSMGEERPNLLLTLSGGKEVLRGRYSSGHKRNLAKAGAGNIDTFSDIGAFIDLFRRTTAVRYSGNGPEQLRTLEALIAGAVSRDEATLLGKWNNGQLHAAAVFIQWEGRSILLKSAADEQGRKLRGLFQLVDAYIAEHADSGWTLDFAGSADSGTARFYAGFGAEREVYLRLIGNRLPLPFRWSKPRSNTW